MEDTGNKAPQDSPHFPNAFYRVSVKGLCVKDGKVLLTYDQSNTMHGDPWELPGGGLDFGENIIDALKREIHEEMGLTVSHVDEKPMYVWPVKRGSGRGMEWFYVLILAYRIEFEHMDFTPTKECQEIKFFTLEDMRQNLPQISVQIRPLVELFNPVDFA